MLMTPLCAGTGQRQWGNHQLLSQPRGLGSWVLGLVSSLSSTLSSAPPSTSSFVWFQFQDMLEYLLRGYQHEIIGMGQENGCDCALFFLFVYLDILFTPLHSALCPRRLTLQTHRQCFGFLKFVCLFVVFALWLEEQCRRSGWRAEGLGGVVCNLHPCVVLRQTPPLTESHRSCQVVGIQPSCLRFQFPLFCCPSGLGKAPGFLLQYSLMVSLSFILIFVSSPLLYLL